MAKKKQPFKNDIKSPKKPVKESSEEILISQAAKDEVDIASKNINKKPLTDRQKFNKYYTEVYLKDIDMEAPHHADKHGILGYEDNLVKMEVWSPEYGKYEKQSIEGLCGYCSKSQPSAKEEYASSQK